MRTKSTGNRDTKTGKKSRAGLVIGISVACLAVAVAGFFLLKDKLQVGSDAVVYVQSVSEITGLGSAGTVSRYSGVVQAKDVVSINPESDMKVEECYVKAGDTVSVGTPLFCYDTAELTLSYEQLLIDIMGLENTIETDTKQIARLDKKLAKAKESAVYELELKRSEVSLEQKKSEFELEEKKEKAEATKKAIDNATVLSPCAGRVKSVKSDSSASDPYSGLGTSSDDDAYITIISGSAIWVKCSVSEQTIHTLSVGTKMLIRSRTDENDVRTGTVDSIVTDTPESSTGSYYYESSSEKASKYPFYVTPDSADGFILGQHVVVEPDTCGTEKTGIWLPKSYVAEEGGKSFVYAVNAGGRIEKRNVTLGDYDEETDTVEIKSGLKLTDKIAFPEETVSVGAKAEELSYSEDTTEDYAYGDEYSEEYEDEYEETAAEVD